MADNGDLNYQVGADVSQASAELQKLRSQINGTTANLQQTQTTIENSVKRMTADIQKSIAQAKAGSDQLLASLRRLDRVQGNTLASQARGNFGTQLTGAAGQQLINEARNSAENVTAKITNELVNQFTQRLRAMDNQVEARLRQVQIQADRRLANTAPDVMAARTVLNDRSNQNAINRANMGDARFGMSQTLERIGSNGGADIITVQARLLAGYQALSLAMNTLQSTAQFVVGLDAEFRQFQAITATTNFEMVTLKDNLIEVSEASKFTALEIAEAATTMGQAGLSAREVGESIGAVAQLATAAGSSLAESVDVVTSTMSIFNLQSSQAADIANTLTAALNLSKLSMDKLVLGFQYAGNAAAQMGITYQELTGVLGALANSGIRSGSTLGTGLRQLLIDIQNPSKELLATLKQIGLTQEDINIENNGLVNVLQTLKESGFGAAQAFETLEVRAAAAYAALSNNTELAVQLQQQFLLSSAAVEANAIQMESLANTGAKFQSVFGTVAYNAFEPLIAVLQDALNAAADFLATLNKYPALLNVLAVAFASLTTAIALYSGSALLRGLLGAIPLFGNLTTAVTGASTAFTVLNTVMKLNPFILAASVIAGLAVGMEAFGNKTADAAQKVDILKGMVNTFRGEADAADAQIEAINQTIENLVRQKAALDSDPLMRTSKILEVKQAFIEISGEVDTTTGTVEELIDALTKLATTDFSKLGDSIRATVAGNNALIAGYENLYRENAQNAPNALYGQISTFQRLDPNGSAFNNSGFFGVQGSRDNLGFGGFRPDPRDTANYQSMITDLFRNQINPQMAEYVGMLFDPSKIPQDINDARSVLSQIDTTSANFQTTQSILQGRQMTGETLTPEELDQLERIPQYLTLLTALKEGLQPLVGNIASIAETRQSNTILQNDAVNADVMKLLNSNLGVELADLQATTQAARSDIRRGAADMTPEAQLEAYKELEDTFNAKLKSIGDRARALAASLVNGDTGYTPDQVNNVVDSQFLSRTASLSAQVSTDSKNAGVDVQALRKELLEQELKQLDDAIQLQVSQQSRASTTYELDAIEDYIKEKFDLKRRLTREMFDAEIAAESDDDKIRVMQAELRTEQQSINREEQQAIDALKDDRTDLQIKMVDDQKAAIDEQIKQMQTKLTDLNTAIAKANPGPVMDAMIAQWEQIALTQAGLINQSNTLGLQSGVLGQGARPVSGSTATRSQQAMQILMGLGYSQAQAAGIVGNLVAESNVNPAAIGDRGQAFGAGQWHPDRQRLLEQYAGTRGTDRNDFETQIRFIDWEMKNSPGTAGANTLEQLMAQTTAGGAADVFRRLYERPSSDPMTGQHAQRIQFANGLMGSDALKYANTQTETEADRLLAEERARINGVKSTSATDVGNFNQQIQALVAQSGASQNPANIKMMIDSVNALYNQIIESKTKAFDTENEKDLDAENPETIRERAALIEGLKADQNQRISSMLETYWKTLDEKIQEPLEDAQRALAEAQKPENAGRFTQADILGLENNVRLEERKVLVNQLAAAEGYLAEVRKRLAETETGSSENNHWLLEEARALEIVNELTRGKNAADAATVQQGPSVAAAIQSATQAWAMQNGILDEMGKQIPLAKQVENAWGGVLDTLSTGFSTLFVDLAKGTMTAEEAFKKFALSVIDSFMQMIAKALAMQVVMALLGDGKDGGGMDWLGTLLGVVAPTPAAANGEYIRGAASGEIIPGFSNRDSVLRKVMPGEMILRRSAVDSIGAGALENINNLGATSMSEGISPALPANDNPTTPGQLNIWVVTPDQVPQMGPQDVIATVADNIQRRGSIKQLIQQVSLGGL